MAIYDVDGVHYDIDTTDPEIAKSKIREYLGQSAPEPQDDSLLGKFTKPFKEGNWEKDSILAPAIKYTAGSIAPDTFPGWKQEGQENLANKGRALWEGAKKVGAMSPEEFSQGVINAGKGIVDNPAGFAGEMAKGAVYDPELLFVGPGGGAIKPTARALERTGEGIVKAGQATADAAQTVARAPGQALKGYDYAVHGRGESAYKPVDPAVVELARQNKLISDRQADLINNRGTLLGEGQGVQGFAENLARNYKDKPVRELAWDVIPSLMTGHIVPGGAIKEAAQAALDTRLGGKVRGTASPDIISTPEGYRGTSPAVQNPTVTTPAATVDTATGAITPMDAATLRKQQFDADNAAKLEQIRREQQLAAAEQQRQQIDQLSSTLPAMRNKTGAEIVNEHPLIQAVKQRAQAQLASSPKDLAIDATTGMGDPAVTANAAANHAKQMLSPDMRAQIAARTAAREAAEKAERDAMLGQGPSTKVIPGQPETNALIPGDKLAELKARLQQQPQAGALFEGMDQPGTTGRGPSAAEARAMEEEARAASGIEGADMSDMGKVYTEAQIRRKYEAYKNAPPGARKDQLKREYDAMENARSDRGLNAGGNPDVMGMMTHYPSKDAFEQAKILAELSNKPFEGSYINEAGNLVSESKMPTISPDLPEAIQKTLKPRVTDDWNRQVRVRSTNPEIAGKQAMDALRKKHGVMKMETGPAVPKEPTAELTMEALKAGNSKLVPGNNVGEKQTIEKVKKTMNILTQGGIEWEQVSPTHLRGRVGNIEYNVIDSNGDIYQTTRITK